MGELGNISRKLRDLTENRHSDSLKKGQNTLFQDKMKREMMLQVMMMMENQCVTKPFVSDTVY